MGDNKLIDRGIIFNFICQALKEKYNCEYTKDIDKLKKEFVLKNLIESDELLIDKNGLLGKFDGIDFCIFEYSYKEKYRSYHNKHDYNPIIKWKTISSVKIPEKYFPEFNIIYKNSFIIWNYGLLFFLVIILLTIFYFGLSSLVQCCFNVPSGVNIGEVFYSGFIFLSMTICLLYFVGSLLFMLINNNISVISSQKKYLNYHEKFMNKYLLTEVKDINGVRSIFSTKVCNSIINFKPEIDFLESKGNCLLFCVFHKKIISSLECEKIIKEMISKAKIFSIKNRF